MTTDFLFHPALLLPAILLLAGLIVLIYGIFTYNRFVSLLKHVEAAFSDIDVLLTKRYNLIPNLVETVKAYARHENTVLKEVIAERTRAMQASSIKEKAQSDVALRDLCKGLFAVAEAYPDLKANTNFLELQKSLTEIEDGIESARRYYNATVREHNILLESIPSNIVGKLFGRTPCVFFACKDEDERQTPNVVLDPRA